MRILGLILFFLVGECSEVAGIITMTRTFNRISPRRYENFLIEAVKEGKEEIVKNLVERGCNVNAKGIDGKTSLMFAIDMGHESIVKYLLGHHCDVDAQTIGDGFSALLLACLKDYENIAEMLINFGANVNATNVDGDTPLMFAVNNKNINLVKKLILRGAKVDHENINGLTPVSVALACYKAARRREQTDWKRIINLLIYSFDMRFIR